MHLACIQSIVVSFIPCDLSLVGVPMSSWIRDGVTWVRRVGAAGWAQTVILSRLGVHRLQGQHDLLSRPNVKLITIGHRLESTRGLRLGVALLGVALALSAVAADGSDDESNKRRLAATSVSQEKTVWMTVGTARFAVILEDNTTATAFAQLLPATFDMTELNGNEKLVRLPNKLPSKPILPGTIRTGDILLYGDNTVVVFYETFQSSYSYTRIGRISRPEGLAKALGPGNPRVSFAAP